MCDVSKRGLSPTVRKQFSHDITLWKLQEDNESKHTWKLAVEWKRNTAVHEIHYHLTLHSSKTYGNEFKKENRSLILATKPE